MDGSHAHADGTCRTDLQRAIVPHSYQAIANLTISHRPSSEERVVVWLPVELLGSTCGLGCGTAARCDTTLCDFVKDRKVAKTDNAYLRDSMANTSFHLLLVRRWVRASISKSTSRCWVIPRRSRIRLTVCVSVKSSECTTTSSNSFASPLLRSNVVGI